MFEQKAFRPNQKFFMARTESILSIFLASPGDVAEERSRLVDAISEWNKTWARNLGVRLEIVRWEDDAYPGIGIDAQDVINRQLPQDFDLFIGIMWTRFGTPTLRAGSGTVEEFGRALEMHNAAPGSVDIFFYFKDTPISPSKIDLDQYLKVQEFKTSLKEEGVLFWDFSDIDQFEKLVSLHITRHVQSWRHRQEGKNTLTEQKPKESTSVSEASIHSVSTPDDDEGLLDLIEIFEDRIAEVTEILERFTSIQAELTSKTTEGTANLELLLSESPDGVSARQARRVIAKVAEEMLQYTARTDAEIPIFRSAISGAMTALTKAATLAADFDTEQTESARTGAILLLENLPLARQSVISYKATTKAIPRITKEINHAKKLQIATLDKLILEFENAEQLVAEAIAAIDALLGK